MNKEWSHLLCMYLKINIHDRKTKDLIWRVVDNKVYKMLYNLYSLLIDAGDSLIIVGNRKLVEKRNIILDKKILEITRLSPWRWDKLLSTHFGISTSNISFEYTLGLFLTEKDQTKKLTRNFLSPSSRVLLSLFIRGLSSSNKKPWHH